MPADWDLPALQQLWSDEDEPPSSNRDDCKRECLRCSRPKSVCLCPWLPEAPLQTAGRIVILQHPHELKKRMATVPLLQKCLGDVAVLRSRYYQPSKPEHAALRQALEGAAAGRYPLLMLFPGATARDVHEVAAELCLGERSMGGGSVIGCCAGGQPQQEGTQQRPRPGKQPAGELQDIQQDVQQVQQQAQQQQARQAASSAGPAAALAAGAAGGAGTERDPLYALVVIDGTWKQAKEMFKVLRPHVLQPDGPGIRVQLPPLAAAQQAQHGALPAADSCAQETAAAAAKVTEQAAAAAEVTEQAAAAAEAAAVQRGAGAGEAEKPLLLRMEPMVGCLTTCEAVARALGALEPEGPAVRDAILRPLAQLAQFQARWDPALALRLESGSGYSQARCRMGLSKLADLTAIA